jgi:7-keto-8-aminopelargonate synthetase-like enzyme
MCAAILQATDHVSVLWEGKEYLFFGGYDYYRLSRHPALLSAAEETLHTQGLNSGGARVTTGTHPLHVALEKRIADFLGVPAAALLPAGYMANLALFEVLGNKDVSCFYHPDCHPSLKTAVAGSGLPAREIPASGELLAEMIEAAGKRPLIVTDGVYGDLPPLREYAALAGTYDGVLCIDEAHALGILGDHGRGAFEHCGLSTERLLLTGSLSKACGASGGFVAGPASCIDAVRGTCAYATTSAVALPMAAAGIAAIDHLRQHPQMMHDLRKRSTWVKRRLAAAGCDIAPVPTPVICIHVPSGDRAARLAKELRNAGIYPPRIRYPGKPDHFRFALSSEHSDAHIERLLRVLLPFFTS